MMVFLEMCPHMHEFSLTSKSVNPLRDEHIIAISQRWHNIELLEIDCFQYITDNGYIALTHGCPRLKAIDLRNEKITDVGIIALADIGGSVEKLDIDSCVHWSLHEDFKRYSDAVRN